MTDRGRSDAGPRSGPERARPPPGDRPAGRDGPAARVRERPGGPALGRRGDRRPVRGRGRVDRPVRRRPPTGSSSRSRPASRARASSASRSGPTRASPATSTRPARRSPCPTSRSDPRFGRSVAEKTAYVPRSIVAVPLVDEQGTIGVLEVLDKRSQAAFSPARHRAGRRSSPGRPRSRSGRAGSSATSGRSSRSTLRSLLGTEPAGRRPPDAAVDDDSWRPRPPTSAGDDDTRLWPLVEQVARIRRADPDDLELVTDILEVLARQVEREARGRRRGRPGPGSRRASDD